MSKKLSSYATAFIIESDSSNETWVQELVAQRLEDEGRLNSWDVWRGVVRSASDCLAELQRRLNKHNQLVDKLKERLPAATVRITSRVFAIGDASILQKLGNYLNGDLDVIGELPKLYSFDHGYDIPSDLDGYYVLFCD